MRVVLDTNVLVSGAEPADHWRAGDRDQPLAGRRVRPLHFPAHHRWGREAWRKPYYLKFFDDREIGSLLAQLAFAGRLVTPATDVHGVAEDEKDDLVLATAVAAQADALVTGDRFLLEIGAFRGIPIVTPRDFRDRLDEEIAIP